MKHTRSVLTLVLCALTALPPSALASNHREAPITALDTKADITDLYAFVSYSKDQAAGVKPSKVTFILCVDPFLEPGNGPNYFPFDPQILYEIKVDNDYDAKADIVFQVRFQTQQRLPGLFTAYAGVMGGAKASANSPAPVAPGTAIVPDKIRSFSDAGLGTLQTYTVTMVRGGVETEITNNNGGKFFAVPANVGPRTMDYESLFKQGTYTASSGISVFAGTVDDPFWIDLGAAFDTLNLRKLGSGIPGVLTPAEDAAKTNFASDTVSGYAVNAIALEVPIEMLTSTSKIEASTSPKATIGVWGTTSRPRSMVRKVNREHDDEGQDDRAYRQVQRVGNPLVNELLIGTGSKDRFSMDQPINDKQFASFVLDPTIARVADALYAGALTIPTPPRTDLLPLVTYAAPIAAAGTPAGPIADLLRLNTGVPATPSANASRLGLLGGDAAGFPNGRRLADDVVDIALRVVVGGVLIHDAKFSKSPNTMLGDGVNVNDAPYRDEFPYLASAPDGRDRRHIDPGETGGGPVQ